MHKSGVAKQMLSVVVHSAHALAREASLSTAFQELSIVISTAIIHLSSNAITRVTYGVQNHAVELKASNLHEHFR